MEKPAFIAASAVFVLSMASQLLAASPQTAIHLIGSVSGLCSAESYCFDLVVEDPYLVFAPRHVRVRYDESTAIFDPENFELSLPQSDIVPGSHLRMQITLDLTRPADNYQASSIWIGD